MPLSKRIIARLDVKGKKLIKGIRFEGLRVLGDSYEAALKYYQSGVDEILYIDSVASLYGRNSLNEVLVKTSSSIFIPITAGGGIRNVEDARILLSSGADKIAINTASIKDPSLITKIAEEFGSQCMVSSIQARKNNFNNQWECMIENGRERTKISVVDWIKNVEKLGAGEILLTSVDQDGTSLGPDRELIEIASKNSKVPLIVGGGLREFEDIKFCFKKDMISGISLATALHKEKIKINELKKTIKENNIPVRDDYINSYDCLKNDLKGISVGIVDYGMGNQQSLINALKEINVSVKLTNSKEDLKNSTILALPGVGSFPKGMDQLRKLDLLDFLKQRSKDGQSIIGICLGMQMLFEKGHEFSLTKGLGLIEGQVKILSDNKIGQRNMVLPHIGWNTLIPEKDYILDANNLSQYFVHSYAAVEVPKEYLIYSCLYSNCKFIAGVRKNNISGFQFHPERSGKDGLNLLANEILYHSKKNKL